MIFKSVTRPQCGAVITWLQFCAVLHGWVLHHCCQLLQVMVVLLGEPQGEGVERSSVIQVVSDRQGMREILQQLVN